MSPKKKAWLWMLLVIVSETSATSTLKMFDNSEGMTKTFLLGLIILLYIVCYFSLSKSSKKYSCRVGLCDLVRYRYSGGIHLGYGILWSAP
ncbi:Uncharacterised protein [Moellerella wisconsensis]|nr:Uncharacterised protein [Moellerella wisconsensis]